MRHHEQRSIELKAQLSKSVDINKQKVGGDKKKIDELAIIYSHFDGPAI